MSNRRVVVTGMAALTPIGLNVEDLWQGMMEGKSGAALITKFDTSRVATKFACELKGYDPLNYIDKKAARRMDLFAQYAMSVAKDVLADAGLDPANMSSDEKDDTGVMIGSGIGGMNVFQEQALTLANHGPNRVSPFFIPMLIPDIASGQVSIEYGFRGPNYCAVSACATSNHNFIDSFMLIKEGQAEMMIVGGTEGPICELGVAGFNQAQALSKRNDSPETASRPFDKTRDGFVMGEGAGALVLEELGHAIRRGAKIYAEIVGYGLTGDAYHITAPDPEGRGARLAMHRALKYAKLEPTVIDYINMHGTSTELGDIAETQSIKAVFGEQAYKMNVSSTKSMTGHLLGAAGAVEAIATILSINKGYVPPTINFENPDPDCDLNYTFNKPQKKDVVYAMSNAFGFGGHNTSIIFKRFEE